MGGPTSVLIKLKQTNINDKFLKRVGLALFALLLSAATPLTLLAQSIAYPKEIRGYKVEHAAVDLKELSKQKKQQQNGASHLIQFGDPLVVSVTPLGITLEIPVVVSPVKQKGHVDFLVFEKMKVNGTSVEIDEYHRAFDLPNKKPLTLKEPLRFYVYLPNAIVAAVDELSGSVKEWPITGTAYVFGRFNKSFFRFKRVIPIDINMTTPNPLHKK